MAEKKEQRSTPRGSPVTMFQSLARGVRDVLQGTPQPVPAAPVASSSGRLHPLEQALSIARKANHNAIVDTVNSPGFVNSVATPEDRRMALLDKMLSGPLTMRQMTAVTGAMPATPKPLSERDKAIATASDAADAMYQGKLLEIAKMPEGEKRDELKNSAAAEYLRNRMGLAQVNPQALAAAGMMPQMGDIE